MASEQKIVDVFVDEGGDGTVELVVSDITVRELGYLPLAKSNDLADSFVITVTTKLLGRALWTVTVTDASAALRHLVVNDIHGPTDIQRADADFVYVAADTIVFTVSAGGQNRRGQFYIVTKAA